MTAKFIFCVHNHQPVDNFDDVFQRSCDDCYLPFLEAMERHPSIKFCAHYSGPLLEWIEKNRLDIFVKIRDMVDRGRLELLGGGFYEPIFSMLPDEDVLGQVEMMSEYLLRHFGAEPKGLWLAERVWEPHLAGLLSRTGHRYSVLDDFHFRAAGLRDEELHGHYVTEDRGGLFNLFPIKERLRYTIPFEGPEKTLEFLAQYPEDATVVYADDGEKFGGWPKTKKHVYEDGWLERFLQAIEKVRTTTFSEALEEPARGRIYLPSCSYREMGEWSLLTQSRADFESLQVDLKRQGRFDGAKQFMPGGVWRNFRVKYPEANLMYGRMLTVSRRVAETGSKPARQELYRGQCNCGYWHGVFGGLYLPHLRGSVYRHLIEADNELEGKSFGHTMVDLDLDGRDELRLTNPALNLFVTPAKGAQILELDVRARAVNLGATLSRRAEHYHLDVRRKQTGGGGAQSIHDTSISKQADLDTYLRYDSHLRTSLVDHFFAPGAPEPDCARDIGDFVSGVYSCQAGKRGKLLTASFGRDGTVGGVPVRVDKEITLPEVGGSFQVSYTILAKGDLSAVFAVEFNIGMLNPQAFDSADRSAGRLKLHDTWHGIDLEFVASSSDGFWVYPVHTVSNSEGGFELNYQCSAVVPRWNLRLAPGQSWTGVVTFKAVTP